MHRHPAVVWSATVAGIVIAIALAISTVVIWQKQRETQDALDERDGALAREQRSADRLRIALAVLLVFCAAPWIAAALGFFLDRVPVLGSIFQTGAIVSYHGDPPHHAVHHGLHHGLDGLILVVTALSLSRVPNRITLFLALMLAYGVADLVNDDWLEQIAERGWTTWTVPSSIEPAANWTWLGVLVATPVIWALWFRQPRSGTITARSNSITTSSC